MLRAYKRCRFCGEVACTAKCQQGRSTPVQRKARRSDPGYVRDLNKAISEGRALPVSFDQEGAIQ